MDHLGVWTTISSTSPPSNEVPSPGPALRPTLRRARSVGSLMRRSPGSEPLQLLQHSKEEGDNYGILKIPNRGLRMAHRWGRMHNLLLTPTPLPSTWEHLICKQFLTRGPPPEFSMQDVLNAAPLDCFQVRQGAATKYGFVKYGPGVMAREAAAMELLRDVSRLPIPQVRQVYRVGHRIHYILMDEVKDMTLYDALKSGGYPLKEEDIRAIAYQLGKLIRHLQSLPAGDRMGSWPLCPYDDQTFVPPAGSVFSNIDQFDEYLLCRLERQFYWPSRKYLELSRDEYHTMRQREQRLVYTNGDIGLDSITIKQDETGKWRITWFLDWGTFGIFPQWYEGAQLRHRIGSEFVTLKAPGGWCDQFMDAYEEGRGSVEWSPPTYALFTVEAALGDPFEAG
ncbi:hypothetical protein DACRYDRAFT_112740 [Dacryopinax primogenitus]|uniref:Aminoglycoside phosphotransferase domain-containing protein n=1 Tax=Dacryopinax primogenitus (strain DJM 731) TaxID=1858805 RepID=M5FY42_DACPD|nr:uncharacterized protein DACRYDRAFT_112740 [Dacryopinax primogenitus]EJT96462.1 hypothetical protein DACRYDRAFT_112740 [Dacryopinax primogenitus]